MLNRASIQTIAGFSLIELMAALVISSFLMLGIGTVYEALLIRSVATHQQNELNHQMQATMDLMVNEIRRAGYWGHAKDDYLTNQNNNPFMTSSTDIYINTAQNCILFSYDADGLGSIPSVNTATDDERYGFRLINNTIQWRPYSADYNCAASASSWENLTNPNVVTITNLTFTQSTRVVDASGTGAGSPSVIIRSITIAMTGQLVQNPSLTRTLNYTVKVQSNKFAP